MRCIAILFGGPESVVVGWLEGVGVVEHDDPRHVWQACRPQGYDDIGSQEVLYDSGYMGSGTVLLINDTIWQLLDNVMLTCQVFDNNDQWCPFLPTDSSPHHDTPSI